MAAASLQFCSMLATFRDYDMCSSLGSNLGVTHIHAVDTIQEGDRPPQTTESGNLLQTSHAYSLLGQTAQSQLCAFLPVSGTIQLSNSKRLYYPLLQE